MNVPSCQINVPPCKINDPPSQINVPHCQINVPLSNNFPKFLRQNHDPRGIYLQEGHIFVSLFDHVDGPLAIPSSTAFKISFVKKPFGNQLGNLFSPANQKECAI